MRHNQNGDGNWPSLWRETLAAISLGWDLALPIFAGVLIGYFLDQWLGTGHIFTLGLLVLGIGIGYYNIARFIRRLNQRDRQQVEASQSENDESEAVSK